MRNNHQYSNSGFLCQDFFQKFFRGTLDRSSISCHSALRGNFIVYCTRNDLSRTFFGNLRRRNGSSLRPLFRSSFTLHAVTLSGYHILRRLSSPPPENFRPSRASHSPFPPLPKQLAYSTTLPLLCQPPFLLFLPFFPALSLFVRTCLYSRATLMVCSNLAFFSK